MKQIDSSVSSVLSGKLRRRNRAPLIFGMFLGTMMCALAPAGAQVRLGPEAVGGNYNVQVMPWSEIPFRSIVRQRYDFSCGSAAVATLLTHHYGVPTTEEKPFAAMWNTGDRAVIQKIGFSLFDMKVYLRSLGFRAEGYRMGIDDMRKAGRPAIALLDLQGYKHFVVVKGIQGDTVLVGDPIRGISRFSVDEFKKAWNGIILAIADTPDHRAPLFNLARDWNPWATAPTDTRSDVFSIGSLTNNLSPQYQISNQLLIDVRVGTVR